MAGPTDASWSNPCKNHVSACQPRAACGRPNRRVIVKPTQEIRFRLPISGSVWPAQDARHVENPTIITLPLASLGQRVAGQTDASLKSLDKSNVSACQSRAARGRPNRRVMVKPTHESRFRSPVSGSVWPAQQTRHYKFHTIITFPLASVGQDEAKRDNKSRKLATQARTRTRELE